MQNGFIFDLNRCTGCSACQIACNLENEVPLPINWRRVLTFNESRIPDLPFYHLSQACNHCLHPPCMVSCPSLAIAKNTLTGAVVIEGGKCIGCGYCSWICPYDAPKLNTQNGVMEKCTLCQHRLEENLLPACVALCPTSALSFGMYEDDFSAPVAGFTISNIKPAITLIPLRSEKPIMDETVLPFDERTIKEFRENSKQQPGRTKINWQAEWPLVIFTVLTALLTGLVTARLLKGALLPDILLPVLAAAGILVSSLHLSKKRRAVRAILNWRHSWLSREILSYAIFFLLLSAFIILFPAQIWLGWLAIIPAYYTLWAIDKIYHSLPLRSQSFQTANILLSALYIAALLSDVLPAALLFAAIKAVTYLAGQIRYRDPFKPFTLLLIILRIFAGFAFPALITTGIFPAGKLVMLVSLAFGEIIDRAQFYHEMELITPEIQMKTDFEKRLREKLPVSKPS